MPTLAIIIVSWNVRELLHHAIVAAHASLAGAGISYRLIVVDNASHDGTPAMVRAQHPEVELLEAGRNLGFAAGNNLALRLLLHKVGSGQQSAISSQQPASVSRPTQLLTQHSELNTFNSLPTYILLLNPDTEAVADAIPQLVAYLEAHPQVAVVGPRLRYPDGSPQPSRRRFPTPGVFFFESTPLEGWWPNNPWARRYRYADVPDDHTQAVGWLVGAALLVRRSAIEQAGLLDEGFAMYSEELEWQRRIQGIGGQGFNIAPTTHRIVYLPQAEIMHHEGKSSAQVPARRYIHFQQSRLRDARQTYGKLFATLLWLALLAAYGLELAIEASKWLVGHKRSLRAQRMRAYAALLRALW